MTYAVNLGLVMVLSNKKKINGVDCLYINDGYIQIDEDILTINSDFTLEYYLYVYSVVTVDNMIFSCRPNWNNAGQFAMYTNDDSKYNGFRLLYNFDVDNNWDIMFTLNAGDKLNDYLNRWVHFAFVKYNGVYTFYVDGKIIDTDDTHKDMNVSTYNNMFRFGTDANMTKANCAYAKFKLYDIAKYTSEFIPKLIDNRQGYLQPMTDDFYGVV